MVDLDARQNRLWTWRSGAAGVVALALLAAAIVFNQSAVHWCANVNDSHYYAYCGWRVSQGAVPYLDVWDNKPPGTWWVNAASFLVCGQGVGQGLLICSIAVGVTICGFVGLARTVYHRSLWPVALAVGIVLLTHLRYECGANRTETFVVPCEILAVLGYLRWRHSGRWGWLVLAGLLAGAAPLFKQSGLAAIGACAAHLALSQLGTRWFHIMPMPGKRWWTPWIVAGSSAIVIPAMAGISLAAQGAVREACFAIAGFNRAYFEVSDATWFELRQAFQPYVDQLPAFTGWFLLIGAGVLLRGFAPILGHRGKAGRVARGFSRGGHKSAVPSRPLPPGGGAAPPDGAGVGVVWLWLLAAVYLAGVGPGRQAYHLAPTLAPLGLLALYPLNWLLRDRSLSERLVARPSLAAALVIYLYVLAGIGADSAGVARSCWATKPHWHALHRDPPAAYEVQAAEIVRRTTPDQSVYVWGWSPGTYRFSYRHCPSRFATLEKVGQVGKRAEFIYEGAVADIQAEPPALLVISIGDLQSLMLPPRSNFARWVDRHYHNHGEFQGMHILQWQE